MVTGRTRRLREKGVAIDAPAFLELQNPIDLLPGMLASGSLHVVLSLPCLRALGHGMASAKVDICHVPDRKAAATDEIGLSI